MLKDSQRVTSRAAILPFPGDPFLFQSWYKMFVKFWRDDIDMLYVYMNSTIGDEVAKFLQDLVKNDNKVTFYYHPQQIEHGEVINRTLDMVKEKYIMLIEDDCYIFTKGIVSSCFNRIESGQVDIVGSKRGSCGMEILKAAQDKWGLAYEGEGDQGPNFWPNLFFCAKELLLKTDRNFGARAWQPGEKIEALDYVVKELQAGDTFVNTSLQLRTIVPAGRINYIPQYHGHPLDLEHYEQRKYLFDGYAPWCHIGSLSSGIGGLIRDDQNRPLARRLIDPPAGPTVLQNAPTNEFETQEYERRVQWWEMFYWSAGDGIATLRALYKDGIDRIIDQFHLNRKRIMRRRQIYQELLSKNEGVL